MPREELPEPFVDIDLPLADRREGKVRVSFSLDEATRLFVTTDRLSAFDRNIAGIPYKGQVLNQLAAWWFARTTDIVANHLVAVPDPNVLIARATTPLPVEVVVRGAITGVTSTSLWQVYAAGSRTIYGYHFPDGLRKNTLLPEPIVTPTTKPAAGSGAHDEPTELEAAFAITPVAVTAMLVAPFVGRMANRLQPRAFGVPALLVTALALFLLAGLPAEPDFWSACWRLVLLGAGVGAMFPAATIGSMGSIRGQELGLGSGIVNMSRQVGFAIGVALFVAVFTGAIDDRTAEARQEVAAFERTAALSPAEEEQLATDRVRRSRRSVRGRGSPDSHRGAGAGHRQRGTPRRLRRRVPDAAES